MCVFYKFFLRFFLSIVGYGLNEVIEKKNEDGKEMDLNDRRWY